jgi:hypothetical protein
MAWLIPALVRGPDSQMVPWEPATSCGPSSASFEQPIKNNDTLMNRAAIPTRNFLLIIKVLFKKNMLSRTGETFETED